MADPAVVLLAAGLSRRYGAVGKLVANYRGKPLALHIADTLNAIALSQRIAICRSGDDDLAALLRGRGFTVVLNPDTARGMSSSLALGIEGVAAADAALICLADMPNVSVAHLNALIDASRNDTTVASATQGGPPTPPAIFPKTRYPELLALEGDKGARALLGNAQLVLASAEELADFDTPQDFSTA
jgi:molybdenum cofactor cytidylyltransferase